MLNPPFSVNDHQWPEPGTVVWIQVFLIYRHRGIVSDRWSGGKPMVISNSGRRGGVFEEPWDEFSQGSPVYLENKVYHGKLPSHDVLHRARSVIGTRYDLYKWNCDDVAAFAHGIKAQYTQLGATLAIVAISCALIGMRK